MSPERTFSDVRLLYDPEGVRNDPDAVTFIRERVHGSSLAVLLTRCSGCVSPTLLWTFREQLL